MVMFEQQMCSVYVSSLDRRVFVKNMTCPKRDCIKFNILIYEKVKLKLTTEWKAIPLSYLRIP